jgi:hypothetical protein
MRVPAIALVLTALALTSCSDRDSKATAFVTTLGTAARAVPTTSDGRVILVTIDGARWQDVFGANDR